MIQTAVQQIMLGKVTNTEENAKQTLAAIQKAGYGGVELNRFMIHPSSLMVRLLTRAAGMPTGRGGSLDWPTLIQEAGLIVPALHTDLGTLEKDVVAVLQDVKHLNTDTVVITGMYRFDYRDDVLVQQLANRLNHAGKMLKQEGISLLYHNHNVELVKLSNGKTAFDLLLEETDPNLVHFELDTYWLAEAGADPLSWMKKLGTRMQMWHINDRGTRLTNTPMTPILQSDSMELGYGNLNLEAMAKQAKANGVRAIILESHRNWADHSPIKSLQLSAPTLKELLKGEQ